MRRNRQTVLAIDEGTTGTRAALIDTSGSVVHLAYRPIDVSSPTPVVVEQDAAQIWDRTRGVIVDVREYAEQHDLEIVAVAIAAQRSTVVLWDAESGWPLSPAVVWQDRRYATDLTQWSERWDDELRRETGRTIGTRAPLLWAARELVNEPDISEAHARGALRFGSMDTWIAWNLTGGSTYAVSTTHATSLGAYQLTAADWYYPWIEHQDFPAHLLPALSEDVAHFGTTDPETVGFAAPIYAAIGDQHAALVGLGAEPGDLTCSHGTGSFVHLLTGDLPDDGRTDDGVLRLVGWRTGHDTVYGYEAFAPTTGSAVRWICEDAGWFTEPAEIEALAATIDRPADAPVFVPLLGGARTPRWDADATGTFAGLTLSTTRPQIARAILDGIAHSVADLATAVLTAHGLTARRVERMLCGGGLAVSDTLLQAQADLLGVPMHRVAHADTAALRGAAYLAGTQAGLWTAPTEPLQAQPAPDVFSPRLPSRTRRRIRESWVRHRDRVVGQATEPAAPRPVLFRTDPTPVDTAPADTTPADTAPADTTPDNKAPTDTTAADLTDPGRR